MFCEYPNFRFRQQSRSLRVNPAQTGIGTNLMKYHSVHDNHAAHVIASLAPVSLAPSLMSHWCCLRQFCAFLDRERIQKSGPHGNDNFFDLGSPSIQNLTLFWLIIYNTEIYLLHSHAVGIFIFPFIFNSLNNFANGSLTRMLSDGTFEPNILHSFLN